MTNNKTPNSAAIIVGIIGVVMVIVGLVLFFSTFLAFTRLSPGPGYGPGFSPGFGLGRMPMEPSFFRAAVGVLLTGAGGFLIKVALGLGVIGNADRISAWIGRSVVTPIQGSTEKPREKTVVRVRCPKCQALNEESARFCSQCGSPV